MRSLSVVPTSDFRAFAQPLDGSRADHDPLLDLVADAPLVLLGEGSHGTHDFYHARAEITKRLIIEKGFSAVAVEADWPDAYRVIRYVRHESDDEDAKTALSGFERFPTWMWRNTVVLDFVEWLRDNNSSRSGYVQRYPTVMSLGSTRRRSLFFSGAERRGRP